VVYSPTPAHASALAGRVGAAVAGEPADVATVCDLTLLTVPDDALAQVSAALASGARPGGAVVHTSGAHGAAALTAIAARGGVVGSLHPPFRSRDVETAVERLPGATFAVEGGGAGIKALADGDGRGARRTRAGRAGGAKSRSYHAALVMASNYTVTLYAIAEALLVGIGAERAAADGALDALLAATVENLRTQGIPMALTGPLTRADAGTVEAHLRALAQVDDRLVEVYSELARLSLPLVVARGGTPGRLSACSHRGIIMRLTIRDIQKMKTAHEPIAMLTAYDATSARLSEAAGVPMLLVGDTLGMVIQGHDSTIPVTLDDVIYHARIVTRVTSHALVVGRYAFMSFTISPEQALANAGRLMQEGRVSAVKLEGGEYVAATIARMVQTGIPVMAHIGLMPQSVNKTGGFRVQGNDVETARQLLRDAKAVEDAGAFAVVLELVPAPLAEMIPTGCTSRPSASARGHTATGRYRCFTTSWRCSTRLCRGTRTSTRRSARSSATPSAPTSATCRRTASRPPKTALP